MRTIRVTGKGQIKLKPDMTRISITLEGTYPEYSETLQHSSEDTEAIKDLLTEYGFERSDLKHWTSVWIQSLRAIRSMGLTSSALSDISTIT